MGRGVSWRFVSRTCSHGDGGTREVPACLDPLGIVVLCMYPCLGKSRLSCYSLVVKGIVVLLSDGIVFPQTVPSVDRPK